VLREQLSSGKLSLETAPAVPETLHP